MGWSWITVWYLLAGAATAGYFYLLVHLAVTDPNPDPDTSDALRDAEKAVGSYPGGMPGFLVFAALLWPLVIVLMIRNAMKADK